MTADHEGLLRPRPSSLENSHHAPQSISGDGQNGKVGVVDTMYIKAGIRAHPKPTVRECLVAWFGNNLRYIVEPKWKRFWTGILNDYGGLSPDEFVNKLYLNGKDK